MARVKRGTKRRARRKKYLKRTKGFFLTKSKLYQSAQEAANRADRYAFRDRRAKKRQYRRLWIQRIGAAARLNGISYGQLIHGLKAAGVELDRKVLADIAVKDAAGFSQLSPTRVSTPDFRPNQCTRNFSNASAECAASRSAFAWTSNCANSGATCPGSVTPRAARVFS